MQAAFLRKLVNCFGFLAEAFPEEYKPAARAFLFSLTNETPDCERPVPEEIIPVLSRAVTNSIFYGEIPQDLTYEEAVKTLDTHPEPVLVQKQNYPGWNKPGILDYQGVHPYYFVLGGFTAYPKGGGLWLLEDRYDWHYTDLWRVPEIVVDKVPEWVLKRFAKKYRSGWYVSETEVLAKWSTPYWHRSTVKLSRFLDPSWYK